MDPAIHSFGPSAEFLAYQCSGLREQARLHRSRGERCQAERCMAEYERAVDASNAPLWRALRGRSE